MTGAIAPPEAAMADILVARLGQDMPANVALMLLLMEAPSPVSAAAALGLAVAARPDLGARLSEVEGLRKAHPGAWATVHAVADSVDHAPVLSSSDAALGHWRDGFDRLASAAPEAGVALYALGDPTLLAAATAEVVTALRDWGHLGPTRDVLDLGCGIGRFAGALAPEVRSVLGLDLSARMIDEAQKRNHHGNVVFAVGSGRDLGGVETAAFDLVLAADVFPYLVGAGLADRHVADMARVLRPGGVAVILNYSYRGDLDLDGRDVAASAALHGFAVERAGGRPFRLWDAAVFKLLKDR
jgi:SAM-dependent methyltransferase